MCTYYVRVIDGAMNYSQAWSESRWNDADDLMRFFSVIVGCSGEIQFTFQLNLKKLGGLPGVAIIWKIHLCGSMREISNVAQTQE